MTNDPSPATIREANQSLRRWLEGRRTSADPTESQSPRFTQEISDVLRRAEQCILNAGPSEKASREWTEEVSSYAATLRELQSQLRRIEVTLRIRRQQMSRTRARLNIVHSWAELASHIG
jgi:hypothetical protein